MVRLVAVAVSIHVTTIGISGIASVVFRPKRSIKFPATNEPINRNKKGT